MEKYTYGAGEMEIAETQCDLCAYQCKDPDRCEKYEVKPKVVYTNEAICPEFEQKDLILL